MVTFDFAFGVIAFLLVVFLLSLLVNRSTSLSKLQQKSDRLSDRLKELEAKVDELLARK